MSQDPDFDTLVELHYPSLYRFALSLTHQESDACDLTQQTFYIWAKKGSQLRDKNKAKSWLFTTLHREYLFRRRKIVRFPGTDYTEAESDLPEVPPNIGSTDSKLVLNALGQVDSSFQAPVALFYLEDYSYPEIAQILEVPLGTVKSRISRGIAQLQRLMAAKPDLAARRNA